MARINWFLFLSLLPELSRRVSHDVFRRKVLRLVDLIGGKIQILNGMEMAEPERAGG